ncbi:glyceraldehyde 3-phosphate reductase [Bacteroidia bacterium]|nr:glyceraldehyde 3-phosphate reductase [Bacteroidia bacterium]
MKYNFCGNSGLQLPEISLGLWHNFGDVDDFGVATSMILYAFEKGITHFDLANNYGPPPGSAETNFGKVLGKELKGHRDELIISSKAGHLMWNGPYGDGGSRKYIMASIDQSLMRTGLEYFDIFYSHRYDPQTPIEETMQALIDIVRQGKALYIGISKYPPEKLVQAYDILKSQHVPCLIYQDKYSMLVRHPEEEHMAINEKYGVGFIAFSPLAQGVLTNKYLKGIPEMSRAHKSHGFLQESEITPEVIKKVSALNDLAIQRGQTLAEMALAWLLYNKQVTSVIVGTSSLKQLQDNLKARDNANFSEEELRLIEGVLAQ